MVTLFLVFIITKGALTLYEGNTIEGGAIRGGDTAQYVDLDQEMPLVSREGGGARKNLENLENN